MLLRRAKPPLCQLPLAHNLKLPGRSGGKKVECLALHIIHDCRSIGQRIHLPHLPPLSNHAMVRKQKKKTVMVELAVYMYIVQAVGPLKRD